MTVILRYVGVGHVIFKELLCNKFVTPKKGCPIPVFLTVILEYDCACPIQRTFELQNFNSEAYISEGGARIRLLFYFRLLYFEYQSQTGLFSRHEWSLGTRASETNIDLQWY